MSQHSIDHILVNIPTGNQNEFIVGELRLPKPTTAGIVIFAHGSGSNRFSPRNNFVADALNGAYIGTMVLDLLTEREQLIDNITREYRFQIDLLAHRLELAVQYILEHYRARKIGLFGASTGASAALVAAASPKIKSHIVALVSRGGRVDLAGKSNLQRVQASTLMIVGSRDIKVLELNQQGILEMHACKHKELKIVPGATHLFEEAGTLEVATNYAIQWFCAFLQ